MTTIPVEWTTSRTHRDVITLEDGTLEKLAVMPCGHAISSSSMRMYCQNMLKSKSKNATCPNCACVWSLDLVKIVGKFSHNEWKQIKIALAEAPFLKNPLYRKCPRCSQWLQRPAYSTKMIECQNCAKETRKNFTFCCSCFAIADTETSKCPAGCYRGTRKILRTCGTTELAQSSCSDCPSVRRCPKCGVLVQHSGGCKHVDCTSCKCEFCFVCLKFGNRGQLFNAHLDEDCSLMPRQM